MPYFLMTWGELPGSKAGPFCRDSRYAISPAVYRIFARDYSNLTSAHVIRSNRPQCPGGGIGRRAGFRCQWLNGREGSSPFLGTTLRPAGYAWRGHAETAGLSVSGEGGRAPNLPTYSPSESPLAGLWPSWPRLNTPKLLDFMPAVPSLAVTVSPSFKSSRTAAARVGIRCLKRKSSTAASSSGESMTWSLSPLISFIGNTQNLLFE